MKSSNDSRKGSVPSQDSAPTSESGKCRRCQAQGQPEHFGDPVKCAFPEGVFWHRNWQCATLGALRAALDRLGRVQWSDDSNAAVTPCLDGDGGFLILGWYKSRGRTTSVQWVREDESRPATLSEVEATLDALEGSL